MSTGKDSRLVPYSGKVVEMSEGYNYYLALKDVALGAHSLLRSDEYKEGRVGDAERRQAKIELQERLDVLDRKFPDWRFPDVPGEGA